MKKRASKLSNSDLLQVGYYMAYYEADLLKRYATELKTGSNVDETKRELDRLKEIRERILDIVSKDRENR